MELQEYNNNDKISELNLPFSTQNIDKMDFSKANALINDTLFQQYNPYNLSNLTNIETSPMKLYEINNPQNNVVAGIVDPDNNNMNQLQQQPLQQTSDIQYVIEDNLIDELIKEENARIQKLDILPNIDDVIILYLSHIKKLLLPINSGIPKLGIFALRLVQMISILYILFGWLFPNDTLKYHISICIFTILSWEVFDDNSMISVIIEKLFNPHIYSNIIPTSITLCKYLVIFFMCISIYGLFEPTNSVFNILKRNINKFE